MPAAIRSFQGLIWSIRQFMKLCGSLIILLLSNFHWLICRLLPEKKFMFCSAPWMTVLKELATLLQLAIRSYAILLSSLLTILRLLRLRLQKPWSLRQWILQSAQMIRFLIMRKIRLPVFISVLKMTLEKWNQACRPLHAVIKRIRI